MISSGSERQPPARSGPDSVPGHERVHRHRAVMGLAAQGYPLVGDDGHLVLHRTAPDDAHPRCEVVLDAVCGGGLVNYQKVRKSATRRYGPGARVRTGCDATILMRTDDGTRTFLLTLTVSGVMMGHGDGRWYRQRRGRGARAEERRQTKIILSEPSIGAAAGQAGRSAARRRPCASRSAIPAFTPHPIQGWTPDFIPYVLAGGGRAPAA